MILEGKSYNCHKTKTYNYIDKNTRLYSLYKLEINKHILPANN